MRTYSCIYSLYKIYKRRCLSNQRLAKTEISEYQESLFIFIYCDKNQTHVREGMITCQDGDLGQVDQCHENVLNKEG